jgi:hypothetical protein
LQSQYYLGKNFRIAPENLNDIHSTLYGVKNEIVCLGTVDDLSPLDLDFIEKMNLPTFFMDGLYELSKF